MPASAWGPSPGTQPQPGRLSGSWGRSLRHLGLPQTLPWAEGQHCGSRLVAVLSPRVRAKLSCSSHCGACASGHAGGLPAPLTSGVSAAPGMAQSGPWVPGNRGHTTGIIPRATSSPNVGGHHNRLYVACPWPGVGREGAGWGTVPPEHGSGLVS